MIWSELGAAMPGSGGTYDYLREGFGRERCGRLMAFLFIWQFILSGPLEIASGYIGFAKYARYIWPGMTAAQARSRSPSASGLVNIALLYRRIDSIGAAHRHALGRHAGDDARRDRQRGAATSTRPSRSTSRPARSTSRSASSSGSARRRASASTTISATTTSATSATRCGTRARHPALDPHQRRRGRADLHRHQPLDHRRGPVARVRAGVGAPAVGLHRLDVHGAPLRHAGGDGVHAAGAVDGVRLGVRAAARLLAHSLRRGAGRHFFRVFGRLHPTKQFPHVSLLVHRRDRDRVQHLLARAW